MFSSSETERLRRELDTARGAHKQEMDKLKTSLRERTEQIDHLKRTHARETERLETKLTEAIQDRAYALSESRNVRESLDKSHREVEALYRQLSDMEDSNRIAAERLDTQSKESQGTTEELSTLRRELDQLKTLLHDRTSELKGAQSFLTTADTLSGAEVISTLQRLNIDMFQSTALMAESVVELFLYDTVTQVHKTDEQFAACKRASGVIGDDIVRFLDMGKHTHDPILIQIAFQTCLTHHIYRIVHAWIIGGDESYNQFTDAIYQSVHEMEAQAIAGRWRALTRGHVPPTSLDGSQIAFETANRITYDLSDILIIAGCTVPRSNIASALSSRFADKLVSLVSLAMRVNKIVGEDVTSGDLEVLVVPPATVFDRTTMEISYNDGGSARARENNKPKVLCPTELGLRKTTRVGMTGEKEWDATLLLKPKVALESIIDILGE